MSSRAVRWVVLAVCAAGIAGMIGTSVVGDNALTLTFGLVTAAAVVCLIVATAVAAGGSGDGGPGDADEMGGQQLEGQVATLVDSGADEAAVRELVRKAVALGRSQSGPPQKKAGAGVHGGRTPRPGDRTFT
ncbi:MAG: hypothetical protein ACR2HV_09970 [Acidimicrobiales bacterium]